MNDYTFCDPSVSVSEDLVEISDGVSLRLIDFSPPRDTDTSPIVLFVAGWVSLVSGWEGLIKALTPRYRMLYLETREKRSAILPRGSRHDFSIPRLSQDIDEVVRAKIGAGRELYFSGSSLGSTVILDYLSRADARAPKKSFVISPICDFPFPPWLLFIINFVPASFYTLVRPLLKGYLKYFRLDRKNEPEQVRKYEGTIDAAEPRRLKANAFAIKDYSLWERLPAIHSSVMIIGAKTDNLHGIETLQKMVDILPDAELELMKSNKETHSIKAGRFIADRIAEDTPLK